MISPKTLRKWLLLEKKEKENETSPPYLASPSTWLLLSKEANLFTHWSPNLHIDLENLQMLIPIFFQDPNNSLLSPWPRLISCPGKAENHFFSPNSHLFFFPLKLTESWKCTKKETLSWTMRKLLTQGKYFSIPYKQGHSSTKPQSNHPNQETNIDSLPSSNPVTPFSIFPGVQIMSLITK